ncbi:hypothetical protein Kisp02_12930 [Kineosporia sp. NBRC 101731]|nr:hypothetical protein Kisp02_12930 [Kineosporia sp. NBRC 101731]
MHRPGTAHEPGRTDEEPRVRPDQAAAPEGERGEVDQAVAGRDEQRHGADPVHVGLEQRRERVLDDRGEEHHQQGLPAHQHALAAQQVPEHRPGAHAQHQLAGQLTDRQGCDRHGVDQQKHADPEKHCPDEDKFGIDAPPPHPSCFFVRDHADIPRGSGSTSRPSRGWGIA